MHYARIEASPRLQRVAAVLADGRAHSTLDIVQGAQVCAVNSIIAELRANGWAIACTRRGDVWWYQATHIPAPVAPEAAA